MSIHTEVPINHELSVEEQLKLADYLWKEEYQKLEIYQNGLDFEVRPARDINGLTFSSDALQYLLRLNADKVQHLVTHKHRHFNLKQFKNLTSLVYSCVDNPLEIIQLIAKDVPTLESLTIFVNSMENKPAWSVEHWQQIQNLKRLKIVHSQTLKYPYLRQTLNQLKLEYLNLNARIEPDDGTTQSQALRSGSPEHLKELHITTTFDPREWSHNYSSFLEIFLNLRVLNISMWNIVTDEILVILAENCKNLEQLVLRFCTFQNISTFALPPKLTRLSLYNCNGLSHSNLKQLLTETKIKEFISDSQGDYEGVFEDFRISPSIEKLDIRHIDMRKFKSAYEGNTNLKELAFHLTGEYISSKPFVTDVPLESCLNLETLNAAWGQIELETVLKLKNLSNFAMPCYDLPSKGSYITAILKHPCLSSLTIDYSGFYPLTPEHAPIEGFSTNVTELIVHAGVFKLSLDFWLDLFVQNPNMKLECCCFLRTDIDIVEKLLNHKNFPMDLKEIHIFGFAISVKDLRTHFDVTINKLLHNVRFNTDCSQTIILRRRL